jgi:mannitol/fructose-specific phosphotransferase system IIA component (Ntr-type)
MKLLPLNFAAPPLLDFEAADENDAIRRTTELMAFHSGITHFGAFVDAIFDRQKINPPILGNGVAIPHARTVLAREIVCVAGRCKNDVPFGPDAIPVRLIFIFGIPLHLIDEYLQMTAELARKLRNPEILNALLSAPTPEDFAALLS